TYRATVELKDITVVVVGSRLGDDVDLRAGVSSVLGAIRIGLNLELSHGLRKDWRSRERNRDVVVVRAVNREVVVARSLAICRDAVRARGAVDIRRKQREIQNVAGCR